MNCHLSLLREGRSVFFNQVTRGLSTTGADLMFGSGCQHRMVSTGFVCVCVFFYLVKVGVFFACFVVVVLCLGVVLVCFLHF